MRDARKPRYRTWRSTAIVTALVTAAVSAAVFASASGALRSAVPPSSSASPTISGTAQSGTTLTASPGSWSGDTPITFGYVWQRCNSSGVSCAAISGATSQTYPAVAADVGSTLRVNVTATNGAGASSALSAPTSVVSAGSGAPANTALPTISGTARSGQVLTLAQGTWSGTSPITFTYKWQRCDTAGNNCVDASAVIAQNTVTLAAADVGHTVRGIVIATNSVSSASATSSATAVVTAAGTGPTVTATPVISGTTQNGQTLSLSQGTWSGTAPITYAYKWQRCDTAGNNCVDASAVIAQNAITLAAADVGHTLRGLVIATSGGNSTTATSSPSAVVTAATALAGATTLTGGQVSIPASSVALPARLVISRVSFTPTRLTTRNPFTLRAWVTDTRGNAVRDALVLSTGLPYGWIYPAGELRTGADGSVLITIQPTVNMPLHRAALVIFLRARKDGDDILAGVSTRRLIQVSIG